MSQPRATTSAPAGTDPHVPSPSPDPPAGRTRSPGRSAFRMLRQAWRYRKPLEAAREDLDVEIATVIRSIIRSHMAGRIAEHGYRWAMWLLLAAALAIAAIALLAGAITAWLGTWKAGLAVSAGILLPACWLSWLWLSWGMALRWMDEHAIDEDIPLREIPDRLEMLVERAAGVLPPRAQQSIRDTAAATRARLAR